MNCTQQYVSKILNGKENLSLDTMTRLEEALGISIVYPEVNAFLSSQLAEEVCVEQASANSRFPELIMNSPREVMFAYELF